MLTLNEYFDRREARKRAALETSMASHPELKAKMEGTKRCFEA